MSMATRCTACGTVFRVVQEQLKASEGWVRCGRCKEVFNALESLLDVAASGHAKGVPAAGAGHAWPPASALDPQPREPAPPVPAAAAFIPAPAADGAGVDAGTADDRGSHGISFRVSAPTPLPAAYRLTARSRDLGQAARPAETAIAAGQDTPLAPGGTIADTSAHEHVDLPAAVDAPAAVTEDLSALAAAPVTSASSAPSFFRDAHVRERWRQPRVRLALAASCVALGLLLLLQIALHGRDAAAKQWSLTRPILRVACAIGGCDIGLLRRLEDVSVETSALTRAGSTPQGRDLLKLDLTLLNRAMDELEMPVIDLRLTDATGQLVIRRSLQAADFGRRQPTLEPDGDTRLSLLFTTGELQVSGYTVEIYYP